MPKRIQCWATFLEDMTKDLDTTNHILYLFTKVYDKTA